MTARVALVVALAAAAYAAMVDVRRRAAERELWGEVLAAQFERVLSEGDG